MKPNALFVILGLLFVTFALLFAQPAVSPMYTLSIERLDFVAGTMPDGTGQVTYQTRTTARSNFVLVFRTSLLMTQGHDYGLTSGAGVTSITFVPGQAPAPGDIVSLIYWR